MTHCLVNETANTFEICPETWGQMLDSLDRTLGADGRVVTAVRFDGVDQPSFRAGDLAAAELAGITRIDIDADRAAGLLTAAVDAAADSLPGLVTGVRLAAAALRSDAPGAQADLAALIAAVQALVALTGAAATAAQVSLGGASAQDTPVGAACHGLEMALHGLVAHQAAERWTDLADALDATLAPAIARWTDVLDTIRERAQA